MTTLQNFVRDEEGAALAEYGLLIGLIAVVCVAGVTALGTEISALFGRIKGKLTPVGA